MSEVNTKQFKLTDLQHRALQIASCYDDYNRASGHKKWDFNDYVDGLVGDVGDLVKLTMAVRGRREIENAEAKLEHELNDVMWSLLLLYYFFRLDPDESFKKAMDELKARVVKMKSGVARRNR